MEQTQSIQKIERLVSQIEQIAAPDTRALAVELVQAMMEYHGRGLERMLEIIAAEGETGYALIDELGGDELTASLLLLYGQHPQPLEARVKKGLDQARPILQTHDGDMELVGIRDGVLYLRLEGTCDGCPSSAQTLKNAIEEAVYQNAPDLADIVVENLTPAPPEAADSGGLVNIKGLNQEEPPLVCPTAT